jgi:hypothetical protein
VARFKYKRTDQYHYARMQNVFQKRKVFLYCLRKLCQRTILSNNNPVKQTVINQEADRRLLASSINGLTVKPERQVRLKMPETIHKTLNIATLVTKAEK